MPAGRPKLYGTPEEFAAALEDYFNSLDGMPPTANGMARHLGFSDRKALWNCQGYGEDYFHAYKNARARIREYWEAALLTAKNPAGPIFWLKNNDDWRDRLEVETPKDITLKIEGGAEGV